MPISKLEWRGALVPFFLAAQILMVRAMAGVEHPPAAPPLASFPAEIGQWKVLREDPVAADMARELGADRLLSRTYVQAPTGALASLFVAWFQTQRGGVRQPHSPKVCLPASGWAPEVMDEVALDTAGGAITVNRYVVANHMQRAVVVYWYQTPRRAIASEWAAKLWLVAGALRDRRTDTALVRVIAWPAGGGDQATTTGAMEFVRNLYPLLRECLSARPGDCPTINAVAQPSGKLSGIGNQTTPQFLYDASPKAAAVPRAIVSRDMDCCKLKGNAQRH